MAKKMISRLSVLAVLIVFLAACSKTVEYTNIIPADATVVTSINLKSLASKAGLNDKENEAAKQKVLEALKSGMNAATFQQLENRRMAAGRVEQAGRQGDHHRRRPRHRRADLRL